MFLHFFIFFCFINEDEKDEHDVCSKMPTFDEINGWTTASGSPFHEENAKCPSNNHQCFPISPMQFSHIHPLQLQPVSSFLQSMSPSITMATNYMPSPMSDSEILSLNHIQTQPVYYTPSSYAYGLQQSNQLSPYSNENGYSPLDVLPGIRKGYPLSMDAAQALLTLHTGDE